MTDIRTDIRRRGPLLFDGAMGTCFAALPGRGSARCGLACLTAPDEIAALHRAYLDAGCHAVPRGAYVFADLGPAPEGAALMTRILERLSPKMTAKPVKAAGGFKPPAAFAVSMELKTAFSALPAYHRCWLRPAWP